MYLEKAKLKEFEEYYSIKCEDFNVYWTSGSYNQPSRDQLYDFYKNCISFNGTEKIRKDIYFIKNDSHSVVGYIYLDINNDILDIPVAIKKEYTGKGFASKAIIEGMNIAKRLEFKKAIGKIREDNLASMRLYTRCGWKKTEDYVNFYSEELHKNIKMYTIYVDL